MSYRNKTYVIFDWDSDRWAYAYMLGWISNEKIDFDFFNAHELNTLTDEAGEYTVKQKLRERLDNTKQAIVLVGASTRFLYRFVRWEIEQCQQRDLPVVVANLNKARQIDKDLCPPILRDVGALHISFNLRIIKYALDYFCPEYHSRYKGTTNWHYEPKIYQSLGL
jgi:hypothetical protein